MSFCTHRCWIIIVDEWDGSAEPEAFPFSSEADAGYALKLLQAGRAAARYRLISPEDERVFISVAEKQRSQQN